MWVIGMRGFSAVRKACFRVCGLIGNVLGWVPALHLIQLHAISSNVHVMNLFEVAACKIDYICSTNS